MSAPDWVTLGPEEEVRWVGRPGLHRQVGPLAVAVGLFLFGVALAATLPPEHRWLSPVAIGLALLVGALAYLRYWGVEYVVTSEEVAAKRGVVGRTVTTVRLDRVQHTAYDQSPLQRLLGYGDVRVDTAGGGGTELVLEDVRDPAAVNALLSGQLGRARERRDGDRTGASGRDRRAE